MMTWSLTLLLKGSGHRLGHHIQGLYHHVHGFKVKSKKKLPLRGVDAVAEANHRTDHKDGTSSGLVTSQQFPPRTLPSRPQDSERQHGLAAEFYE